MATLPSLSAQTKITNPNRRLMLISRERLPKTKQPIVVRNESENEQHFPAEKLIEAVQTANGIRGWVELRNRDRFI